MEYFPLFFNLRGRVALIVGGGDIARRKADLLMRGGARIRAVAPVISAEFSRLLAASGNDARLREYDSADLQGCAIAVAATDDMDINRRVRSDARGQKIPANVVDCPDLCDFIFPSIAERGPLAVAVSSMGFSPVLARMVRAKIESVLPAGLGRLAEFAARFRATVKSKIKNPDRRRIFWEDALAGTTAEYAMRGDDSMAEKLLRESLDSFAADSPAKGEVYLIGAGPGDPDLLTFKSLRLLQKADVVVHDRLVAPAVVDLARRDAARIFVGKERNRKAASQDSINRLLIKLAREGRRVARLKGGDPFIFGRGGEESQALSDAGIKVEIAPGITAAMGCAAAAGIPLTHRKLAHSLILSAPPENDDDSRWRELAAQTNSTIAFYMAGQRLGGICRNLIIAGRKPQTPAAIICNGTTPAERIISATLADLPIRAAGKTESPALLLVGETIAMGENCQADGGFQLAEYFPKIA